LLTLATTIGESLVAAAPSIVVPVARANTGRPSRSTVIETAAFRLASRSNAAFVAGRSGFGKGSSVVVVAGTVVLVEVDVLVVDVLVVVVVVVDVVVVDVVVVLAGGGLSGRVEVVVRSVRGGSATGGAAEDCDPSTPQLVANSAANVMPAMPRRARVDRPLVTRRSYPHP